MSNKGVFGSSLWAEATILLLLRFRPCFEDLGFQDSRDLGFRTLDLSFPEM